jgi:hypothetical protein
MWTMTRRFPHPSIRSTSQANRRRVSASLRRRNTVSRRRLSISIAGLVLIVAACGGSGTPTTSGAAAGATQPGSNPTQAAPGDTTAPTQAATTTTGGGTASACDLLTIAEVSAATGQAQVTTQVTAPGNFDGQSQCAFIANGVLPVAVVTVLGANTNMDPTSYLALTGTVTVAVNGAQAVFMPAAGNVMIVFKNNKAVSVQIGASATEGDLLGAAKALVQHLADRM